MNALYVYAVVLAPGPDASALLEEPLKLVDCGGLQAAVGPVDDGVTVDAASLRAHDAVVRKLHGVTATVPMRFGSTVPDERALRGWVETVRPILERGLEEVRDREQMTIRIYGDADAFANDPPPQPAERRGTQYLISRRQAELPPRLEPIVRALRRRLGDLVKIERLDRHTTPPLSLTVRHLIARGTSDAYRSAVSEEASAFERWTLRVTGPWPPYAFTPEELSR